MAGSKLQALWNHPAGPRTIHFWAPTFKWVISIANIADFSKPPEQLSYPHQSVVACSGIIWSRYSTVITPKNWNLVSVNLAMAGTGLYQLSRKIRISSRFPRTVLAQCRNSLLVYYARHHHHLPVSSNQFQSARDIQNKVLSSQVSVSHHSTLNASAFQQFGFSSSASPETTEKGNAPSTSKQGSTVENNSATTKTSRDTKVFDKTEASSSEDEEVSNQKEESGSSLGSWSNMSQSGNRRRRRGTKRTAFSDFESEAELSMEDLVKLVAEKEELLTEKHKEVEKMQDKILRTYAEMENVMDRTRRESENSKNFAIQGFAKSLLDVGDNLCRASSVVKDSFSKVDTSKDPAGAVSLLKTLLEGVEMTEKQLTEVLKKFGVEKYEPRNEQFDPNRHNAVFQVPDPSKSPGTVAVVLKVGYMLNDRVLRPAEVGVTVDVDNEETNQSSEKA